MQLQLAIRSYLHGHKTWKLYLNCNKCATLKFKNIAIVMHNHCTTDTFNDNPIPSKTITKDFGVRNDLAIMDGSLHTT